MGVVCFVSYKIIESDIPSFIFESSGPAFALTSDVEGSLPFFEMEAGSGAEFAESLPLLEMEGAFGSEFISIFPVPIVGMQVVDWRILHLETELSPLFVFMESTVSLTLEEMEGILPSFEIEGFSGGEILFSLPGGRDWTFEAEGTFGRVASIETILPSLEIENFSGGDMVVSFPWERDWTFEADGVLGRIASPEITLPSLSFEGFLGAHVGTSLPFLEISGELYGGRVFSFLSSLPALTLSCYTGYELNSNLPSLLFDADGTAINFGLVNSSLPSLSLLMIGESISRLIEGSIPFIELEMSGLADIPGSMNLYLIQPIIFSGEVLTGSTNELTATIPKMKIRSAGTFYRAGGDYILGELQPFELTMRDYNLVSTVLRYIRGKVR